MTIFLQVVQRGSELGDLSPRRRALRAPSAVGFLPRDEIQPREGRKPKEGEAVFLGRE